MGALAGRRERRQWAPEPVVPPYLGAPTPTSPPLASRPETALVVPAVWACVQLLANAVSMLPLCTYRRVQDGVPARITDPPIVATPTQGMTQSEWLHMLMVSLLLRGNAYGLLSTLDTTQRWSQVVLLNPDRVRVDVNDQTGEVRYFTGPNLTTDVTDRIWHVRGFTLPGAKIGLSPIEYAAAAIGVDLSSRKFARDFFDGGGVPKATLTTDLPIDQQQADIAKQRLRAATLNREPAVFGSGIKYTPISVKPEESQFLATQRANISEIARYYGIPAEMVGGESGSSLTYSNVEQRSLDFLTYGVSFWLKRIEDAYFTLLPQPQYVSFDETALLRTDAETQARVRVLYIAGKVLPPSRVLRQMNEAPLTEDEKTELELVPLTVSPIGRPSHSTSPNVNVPTGTPPQLPATQPAPAVPPRLGVVNG